MSQTRERASCSEEGIFFKANCAASLSWRYRKNSAAFYMIREVCFMIKLRQHTWRAFTRSERGGRPDKILLIVSSGGFAFLKNECFSNFSAVGLFV